MYMAEGALRLAQGWGKSMGEIELGVASEFLVVVFWRIGTKTSACFGGPGVEQASAHPLVVVPRKHTWGGPVCGASFVTPAHRAAKTEMISIKHQLYMAEAVLRLAQRWEKSMGEMELGVASEFLWGGIF